MYVIFLCYDVSIVTILCEILNFKCIFGADQHFTLFIYHEKSDYIPIICNKMALLRFALNFFLNSNHTCNANAVKGNFFNMKLSVALKHDYMIITHAFYFAKYRDVSRYSTYWVFCRNYTHGLRFDIHWLTENL